MNLILKTDSYKVSHWRQYPPHTTNVYSYYESRVPGAPIVFFGLQYIILKHLRNKVTNADIVEAYNIFEQHFGDSTLFNIDGWKHIVTEHAGFLPLRIKAVDEGTIVPGGNVMMTIENTCERVPWLTNYVETLLSQVWYPCTIATNSREMRNILEDFARATADDENVVFKLHDFGYRGSTSEESAGIGGAAHLISFLGTDTLAAIETIRQHYPEREYGDNPMPGFSIPAAEHSTITSWGREHETVAYNNMLDQYPTGLVAVVSDSYDVFNAVSRIWGESLKDKVMAREGTVVIRPDSGDPVIVIPRLLKSLGEKFGATVNSKGYWVLPPNVRLIQGDGIDKDSMLQILEAMKIDRWSVENIAFGSGGGLLQKFNRDTYRFAIKASDITFADGTHRDVYKDPVTDIGKRSKAGRLALIRTSSGRYETVAERDAIPRTDLLRTVFEDGRIPGALQKFSEIRSRAAS